MDWRRNMGTRGLYGYIIDGVKKLTYNHWDSYPGALGMKVLTYLEHYSLEDIKKAAERIVLVGAGDTPSKKHIELYNDYKDTTVSSGSVDEWYVLLRETHGNLAVYHEGVVHMIDNKSFFDDNLFCEWTYIINLDTKRLEVYEGKNQLMNYDLNSENYDEIRSEFEREFGH